MRWVLGVVALLVFVVWLLFVAAFLEFVAEGCGGSGCPVFNPWAK